MKAMQQFDLAWTGVAGLGPNASSGLARHEWKMMAGILPFLIVFLLSARDTNPPCHVYSDTIVRHVLLHAAFVLLSTYEYLT